MNAEEPRVRVRRMSAADLERVLEIGVSLPEAPRWPVSAYVAAMNPENRPRRIALVLEGVAEGESSDDLASDGEEIAEKSRDAEETIEGRTAGAKAHHPIAGSSARLKLCPDTGSPRAPDRSSFSMACEEPARQGGDRILGFAVASLIAPEAELETIAVVAKVQRRGLGALLLRALAEELRKVQVSELNLEVRASNRTAVGFYSAHGFEGAGRRMRYYADPEEDAVLMRLKFE